MLELPRIKPSYADDKSALQYGTEVFSPGTGASTIVSTSKVGSGLTLQLRYEVIKPSEVGRFALFFNTIRYDKVTGTSGLMFFIPAGHPAWDFVSERDYLEDLLTTKDFDTAKWRITRAGNIKTPILNVNNLSFSIVNEFG